MILFVNICIQIQLIINSGRMLWRWNSLIQKRQNRKEKKDWSRVFFGARKERIIMCTRCFMTNCSELLFFSCFPDFIKLSFLINFDRIASFQSFVYNFPQWKHVKKSFSLAFMFFFSSHFKKESRCLSAWPNIDHETKRQSPAFGVVEKLCD